MKLKHVIIYITGLGDHNPVAQEKAIKAWCFFGEIDVELFQNNWADKKPFSEKLERLLSRIDQLNRDDYTVSLVGVSAGASMALTAFSLRKEKINGVVSLCGKINNARSVSRAYYNQNPAFHTSLHRLKDRLSTLNSEDKEKIFSIYPLFDQTVPVRDMKIAGVRSRTIPTILHIPSIALGITVFSWIIIDFLKKRLQ